LTDVGSPRELGARGERQAAEWYRSRGWDICATNWRCRDGELDLVVRRGRSFVFCEVKTRSSSDFGAPVEAVTRAKQARLRRLAARWLEHENRMQAREIRFDVVSILGDELTVIEGAF
jgi:putative endonuclease